MGIGESDIQGVKKVPGPPSDLRFILCEETSSHLFNHRFSHILNHPCKTSDSVVEDIMHFIENEFIPDLCNRLFVSSLELNSRCFKTPSNILKNQKL
jgi:hypothetical protein